MTWMAAEKFCVSKGGHLASVASPSHRQKLQSFIKSNQIWDYVWLGGTDEANEGNWTWTDGSKWSEEHWRSNRGNGGSGQNCLRADVSGWNDDPCRSHYRSICSVPTITTLSSSTQLVFTSENISIIPAIQVRWVAQPMREDEDEYQDAQNNTQSNLTPTKQIPGFKIRWKLRGQTKEISNISHSNYEWMKKNHLSSKQNNVNMMTIISLVRESKRKRIHENKVWKTLLKHRWYDDFLKANSSCLNGNKKIDVIYKTAQDLKINYDSNQWIAEDDLKLGTELYSVLSCPTELVEAAKLSKLFESLITNENLNTVVAATMHNIQPRAGDNIKDFTVSL